MVSAESDAAITTQFPELKVVDKRPSWMTDETYQQIKADILDLSAPSGLLADILSARMT